LSRIKLKALLYQVPERPEDHAAMIIEQVDILHSIKYQFAALSSKFYRNRARFLSKKTYIELFFLIFF